MCSNEGETFLCRGEDFCNRSAGEVCCVCGARLDVPGGIFPRGGQERSEYTDTKNQPSLVPGLVKQKRGERNGDEKAKAVDKETFYKIKGFVNSLSLIYKRDVALTIQNPHVKTCVLIQTRVEHLRAQTCQGASPKTEATL